MFPVWMSKYFDIFFSWARKSSKQWPKRGQHRDSTTHSLRCSPVLWNCSSLYDFDPEVGWGSSFFLFFFSNGHFPTYLICKGYFHRDLTETLDLGHCPHCLFIQLYRFIRKNKRRRKKCSRYLKITLIRCSRGCSTYTFVINWIFEVSGHLWTPKP